MSGSFIGMIFGSSCLKYFTDWQLYYENPAFLLDINRGGISEVGAIVTAIIVAIIMCKVKRISFFRFSEITSPAVLLTMAIGRWGCYMNGCCHGITGHPTQLYYSFSATIILSIVLMIENYNRRTGIIRYTELQSNVGEAAFAPRSEGVDGPTSRKGSKNNEAYVLNATWYRYGVVSPIGLGLYSIARIIIDPYRAEADTKGIILSDRIFIVCAGISLLWIIISIIAGRRHQDSGKT